MSGHEVGDCSRQLEQQRKYLITHEWLPIQSTQWLNVYLGVLVLEIPIHNCHYVAIAAIAKVIVAWNNCFRKIFNG